MKTSRPSFDAADKIAPRQSRRSDVDANCRHKSECRTFPSSQSHIAAGRPLPSCRHTYRAIGDTIPPISQSVHIILWPLQNNFPHRNSWLKSKGIFSSSVAGDLWNIDVCRSASCCLAVHSALLGSMTSLSIWGFISPKVGQPFASRSSCRSHSDVANKGRKTSHRAHQSLSVERALPTSIWSTCGLKLSGRESLFALVTLTVIHWYFVNLLASSSSRYGNGKRRIHLPSSVTPAVQETSTPFCAGTGYVRTVIKTRFLMNSAIPAPHNS
jgi:hypothetical protein